MGAQRPRPVVLDAGALVALERGNRRVARLLELADVVAVPAPVLAQVWRDPSRQVRLARVLRAEPVRIVPLDEGTAHAVGRLCGVTGTADIADASVAVVARLLAAVVVTGDPVGAR